MVDIQTTSEAVVRTERGLALAGTRITLYDILDYLHAGWPTGLVQHWLNITPAQLQAALDYIVMHRQLVESEYQTVLEHASANREYWDAQALERRKQMADMPVSSEQKALFAKLKQRKVDLGLE